MTFQLIHDLQKRFGSHCKHTASHIYVDVRVLFHEATTADKFLWTVTANIRLHTGFLWKNVSVHKLIVNYMGIRD